VAFVLTGCRLEVRVDLDVARDGSGQLGFVLRADREAQERAQAAGADPLAVLVDAGARLRQEGWAASDRTDPDGTREVSVSVEFADPAALDALTRDLTTALDDPEGQLLESLRVVLTEERIRVEGAAALQPRDAVIDYGLGPEELVTLLRERDALGYTLGVTLPGEVLAHNATRSQERGLEWDIAPGERVELAAEGVRPSTSLLPVIASAAGALALVGLLVGLRARRTRQVLQPPRPE
jgi:hypothetical protein